MSDPTFTPEQEREIEQRVSASTGRVLKRAFVGYFILFCGVLAMYWSGQHVSSSERDAILDSTKAVVVDSCNRDYRSTQRLRHLLQSGLAAISRQEKNNQISPDQAATARQFYAAELAKIPLPDCRTATDKLTDNPDDPIRVPVPLHEPDQVVVPLPHLYGFPH